MEQQSDFILLKWGTLKGWRLENSPQAFEALKKYNELGYSMSAMLQRDSPEQKALLCEAIDKVNGEVSNDWSGEIFTKESAKQYIMDYGKEEA